MPRSRLTKKGQATIPLEIRERLSLKPGDQVEFIVLDNGTVMIQPAYIDVMDLQDVLPRHKGKPLSLSAVNKIIRERAQHDRG